MYKNKYPKYYLGLLNQDSANEIDFEQISSNNDRDNCAQQNVPLVVQEEEQHEIAQMLTYQISDGQKSQKVQNFMTTKSTANQTTKSSSSETAKKEKKKKKQRRNKNITQCNQYGNEHENAEVITSSTKDCPEQFLKEEDKSEMIIEFSWQEQQQPDYNCEQKFVQEQISQIQASQQQYDHNFLQTFIKNFQNQYRSKKNAGINWLISRGKEIKNSKNGNISYRQKDLKNMTKEHPETAKLGLQYLENNSKYSNQKKNNDIQNLLCAFLVSDGINHGLELHKSPVLSYLFYLKQIGVAMSPVSNNRLFCRYQKSPFQKYFQIGLNVCLSTDDPLILHLTNEPLLEEYAIASQIFDLSAIDQAELARNSVRQSGFEKEIKQYWVGENYDDRFAQKNAEDRNNLPATRFMYRKVTLNEEYEHLEKLDYEPLF